MARRTIYTAFGKRFLDILGSLAGFVLLGPVLLIVAVLVRWRLGSPVFFRQSRPGRNGKPFRMIKFRTMTDARDESGQLLPDDQRLTRFGRFLRKTSLDELPELWNVLTGKMSLVGPRPLLTDYLEFYTPEQARRHDVRPGITGWAQVNGRNAISWEERFALDTWYVDHVSLGLDVKTMLLTVWRVIRPRGISAEGHATMPRFDQMPRSNQVAVIGAGGHAKVVIHTLRAAGYEIGGVYDDDSARHGETIEDVPIIGSVASLGHFPNRKAVIAIGDNTARATIAASLKCEWVTVVHPSAVIADGVTLGAGTVVMAGAIVQPATALGCHVIVNTAASIDHDCVIEDGCHIAPGSHLAGGVVCESRVLCGIGSAVAPGVRLGADATLGAGATAVSDIPSTTVAIGTPAQTMSVLQSRAA